MLEPLDERAAGQRLARRRGAERRWGVIVALVVFIGVMVALSKWGTSEEGKAGGGAGSSATTGVTTTGVTTTGVSAQGVGGR